VSSGAVAQRSTSPLRERLLAYKDLAKLVEWGAFLTVPLTWSLLDSRHWTAGRSFVLLGLSLLIQVGVRTAESALDDVAGVEDRIDVVNYAQAGPYRPRARKPLLDGRLTEDDARRYAYAAASTGLLAFVAAFAVAGFEPLWVPPAVAFAALAVIAYSWGPKLSYRGGGQELVVVSGVTVSVCATFGMIEHGLTWRAAIQGVAMGVFLVLPVQFANLHDLEGDRQAGRETMAVLLSAEANARYVLGLFAVGWAVLVAGVAAGQLRWWYLLLLLPSMAIHAYAIDVGVRGSDYLRARRPCHRAYRLAVLALFIANLLALH
jgi:1,4-dihydroxy-2-naphthoate polyprenyltransferase